MKWPAFSILVGLACIALVGEAAAQRAAPRDRSVRRVVDSARAQLTVAFPLGTLDRARSLTVTGRNFAPRAAVVVTQCSRAALAAALTAVRSALDDCDERYAALAATATDGSFSVRARAAPVIQTATGAVDCRRPGACLLGALNLDALQAQPLQVAVLPLAFAAETRLAPVPAPAGQLLSEAYGTPPLTARRASRTTVTAYPAGAQGAGRSGQVPSLPTRPLPRRPLRGEGLLALTMSAPQTNWGDPADLAVVVQARVDRGSWQQIVLFEGAQPFTYEGFTGPLRTGPHRIIVRIRRALSHVTRHPPLVVIARQSLTILTTTTRAGFQLAHAPVLYERRVATTQDTPLLTYATEVPQPGGLRRLTYVVAWSHEDAGTGFLPWLEWGTWGRMTDIETAVSFSVDHRGSVSNATYLTCVTCGQHFPENRTALDETEAPFRGAWFHGHPVLRVATGNNDLSDRGITALRFQQALAAPPRAGQTREGAMDRNPWTYQVMGEELQRDRTDYSTAAASPGPGDPRQYLIVALSTRVQRAAAVGVDIGVSGSPTTYSNDLQTTYPLYDGGRGRTVVKLPLTLVSRPITLLRLRLLGSSASLPPSLAIDSVQVLQLVDGRIIRRRIPRPQVIDQPAPPATGLATPTIATSP